MQRVRPSSSRLRHWAILLAIPALSSCSDSGSRSLRVAPPSIDAEAIANEAMALLDANRDSFLAEDELGASPSLKQELTRFDADKDGKISEVEISTRLAALLQGSSGLMSFSCSITLGGRALSGATVTLAPEEFLTSAIKPATGITDGQGSAELSVDADQLPKNYEGLRAMQPGLYKVRVTHPQVKLADRYNERTELGCEVSGESANPAFPVRFALKKGG